MKLFVDVVKLEAEGIISPQQAVQIRRSAAADTGVLAVNVIAVIGAFAVIAGLLAMRPTSVQVAVIGFGLTIAGALIRKFRQTQLGFLGSSLIVIGAVLLAAGLVLKCSTPGTTGLLFTCPATPKWYGHAVIFLVAAAWLLTVGALAQNGLLVVLCVFALAGALGSSTGYWHASYGLLVREATVTIVVFGLLGAAASYLSMRVLEEPYARLARLFALMALLWVNFGFWVGSLWGDYPLEAWMAPDLTFQSYTKEAWDALQAWKAQAFFISREVFAVIWALALAGVGTWGAITNRRGAVNMAATFAGIHFYTQWFERLNASPEAVMIAGVIAVAIAFALWRYNQGRQASV